MNALNMTSNRPYLLRAFYEWLVDNDLTPHLLIDATNPLVQVPQQYVREGQIVLNVAPQAIVSLVMDNHAVSFNAKFEGVPFQVYAPMTAILGIHARENGVGTFFPANADYLFGSHRSISKDIFSFQKKAESVANRPDGRPNLRIVK